LSFKQWVRSQTLHFERGFFYILFCPISIRGFYVGGKTLRLSIHLVLQTDSTVMISKSNQTYYNSPYAKCNECVTFPLTGIASDLPKNIDI